MNSIIFYRERNGKREEVKFEEGQKFELNGCTFKIVTIKEKGKMVIKPA